MKVDIRAKRENFIMKHLDVQRGYNISIHKFYREDEWNYYE